MLLTISYSGHNTEDLGYLLYKNPKRPQMFELSSGKAYVFYPEVSCERTTAAMLLDIDPIDLARGKADSGGGLFDYVNDRPYVSSSFLSSAISKVFGTAMTGRADDHQALSDSPLNLEAAITMLPCRGETSILNRVFEPLGYTVNYETFVMDGQFPDWGKSKAVNLTLKGNVRLRDLLNHIYVLVPVFDRQKHYWVGEDEVDKLLRYAESWLPDHPEKKFITSNYLKRLRPLVNMAFERLFQREQKISTDDETAQQGEAQQDNETTLEIREKKLNLNLQRLGSVVAALKNCGAKSVIDLGCGSGNLLGLLAKEKQFERIAGMDISHTALEYAADKLKLDRVTLFHGSLTYKDARIKNYDAACVIEVIEHFDLSRIAAFERALFEFTHTPVIVLTTPNREYNVKYENLNENEFRHEDHRFEWNRMEFHQWAEKTAARYGYEVKFSEIGGSDETLGAPTQMGVFTLCV